MWEVIQGNVRGSLAIALLMAGLLLALGYVLGEVAAPGLGYGGILAAGGVWVVLALVSYFQGDKVLLALSGARKIRPQDHPVLFNVVEEMSIAAGLPKPPDVYIMDEQAPNAFATGRKPQASAVAVTAGLLEILTRDELQGVIAHEIAHVKNRDVLYMQMVGVLMGAIVLLADAGLRSFRFSGRRRTSRSSQGDGVLLLVALVLMILAPLLAQLLYFALSRKREYLADACGAQFSRYPEGLASALEKIARHAVPMRRATRVTAPMYIANPLALTQKGLRDLTSTHPPISERVRILRAMGSGASLKDYEQAYKKVSGRPVGVVPFSALASAPAVAAVKPAADDRSHAARVRETSDALWKVNRYAFLSCPCGIKLKVPPAYRGTNLSCPRCGRVHLVEKAA